MTNIPPPPPKRSKSPSRSPQGLVIEGTTDGEVYELPGAEIERIYSETLKPQHKSDVNIIRFIHLYCTYQNRRRAAEEMGLNIHDANNLLRRPDIAECVRKINSSALERFGYTAEELVEVVKGVAFFDPADLVDKEGAYIDNLRDLPLEVRSNIKKLKVKNIYEKDPNGIVVGVSAKVLDYEFYDRMDAVKTLGAEKDVFKKVSVVEHEVGKNARNVLLGSQERALERMKALAEKEVVEVRVGEMGVDSE